MAKPLRVLIVEDSEDDALLVIRELKRGGYAPTFERVDTAEAMRAALAKQTWEVVLADYVMPHFSVPEALELLHQSSLDLPFIVISGTIGEETAVAIMKDGAHDYLMKGNLKRLVPAVERELREAEVRKERKKAEVALRHAAEEWRTTFDSITDSVSIHDKDSKIVRVNKAYADTFNMKPGELIGKHCYELVHGTKEPTPNCPHQKTLATKKPAMTEFLEPHLGIYLQVSTSPIFDEKGEVVGSVHIMKDITERKKIDEQLILTDRLASVGEMASGIAHELNNPLTSVIGFSELLMEREIPDDVKEDIYIIHSEAQRTAQIVKNLLTFARKHEPVKQLTNMNDIIKGVLKIRDYEQRINGIRVNTQLDSRLSEVMVDYFQMQQVFLNIIINAETAMLEAHNRGTLTVTTQKVNDTISSSFTDDGPGIAKETLKRIFDPFFTTKEVGKGTGLGLSICHGIVAEHGGKIYARSELGKGATFVVELPTNAH